MVQILSLVSGCYIVDMEFEPCQWLLCGVWAVSVVWIWSLSCVRGCLLYGFIRLQHT